MRYADYEYYLNIYGGALTEDEFNAQIVNASAYLDYLTMCRINKKMLVSYGDAVKLAACAVAEVYHRCSKGELVSQSVGSWHKTYKASDKGIDQQLTDAAERYLLWTGLIYRGCV